MKALIVMVVVAVSLSVAACKTAHGPSVPNIVWNDGGE